MQVGTAVVGQALVAVAACAALAGCEADLTGSDDAADARTSTGAGAAAKPGRFSVLPDPCESVDEELLRELLPGGDAESYEGVPMATFDTGRRVGCSWHGPTESNTRRLSVDFERVISYDPQISDDDQAKLDFEALAAASGVTLDAESDSDPGSGEGPDAGATAGGAAPQTGPATAFASGGRGSAAPPGTIEPTSRQLDDIGHVAFLDDRLTSLNTGSSRHVTVAFRSSNVIVTVNYTVSTTVADDVPNSALLQEGAQEVARQLAGGFDG